MKAPGNIWESNIYWVTCAWKLTWEWTYLRSSSCSLPFFRLSNMWRRCVKMAFHTPSLNSCNKSTTSIMKRLKPRGESLSEKVFFTIVLVHQIKVEFNESSLTAVGTRDWSLKSLSIWGVFTTVMHRTGSVQWTWIKTAEEHYDTIAMNEYRTICAHSAHLDLPKPKKSRTNSVLKSGCRTNQRPATEPNRNRLRVDRGCWLRGLRNSLGCGCVLWEKSQRPVADRSQPVFSRHG